MTKPDDKLYVDVSPTTISLIQHYSKELSKAVGEKNLERVKVVRSVLMCLNPTAFKKK